MLAWQGRPEEAEPLIQHGERIVTPEIEPGAAIGVCFARAILSWHAAGITTRWPPPGPSSGWQRAWRHRTWLSRERGHCNCWP